MSRKGRGKDGKERERERERERESKCVCVCMYVCVCGESVICGEGSTRKYIFHGVHFAEDQKDWLFLFWVKGGSADR